LLEVLVWDEQDQSFLEVSNKLVLEWQPPGSSSAAAAQPELISELEPEMDLLARLLNHARVNLETRPLKAAMRLWSLLVRIAGEGGPAAPWPSVQHDAVNILVKLEKLFRGCCAKFAHLATKAKSGRSVLCGLPGHSQRAHLEKRLEEHLAELRRSMDTVFEEALKGCDQAGDQELKEHLLLKLEACQASLKEVRDIGDESQAEDNGNRLQKLELDFNFLSCACLHREVRHITGHQAGMDWLFRRAYDLVQHVPLDSPARQPPSDWRTPAFNTEAMSVESGVACDASDYSDDVELQHLLKLVAPVR